MDEFHGHLDSQATKFSKRVFSILDQDLSGNLDLREFIIGVWNYCTYDTTLISKVTSCSKTVFWLFCSFFGLLWDTLTLPANESNAVDRHETPRYPCIHHGNNTRAPPNIGYTMILLHVGYHAGVQNM